MTKPADTSYQPLPEPLAQAVAEISELQAPADAVERLIENTSTRHIEPARSATPVNTTSRRGWLRWAIAGSIAAAVLITASFWPATQSRLFANMQQAMSDVKTIKFVSHVIGPDQEILQKLNGCVNEEGSIRQENAELVLIQDVMKRKGLELHLTEKRARVYPLYQQENSREFLRAVFDVIRGEEVSLAEEIGAHEIEGVKVVEYEVKLQDAIAQIFIEAETSKPVKIVVPMNGENDVRVEVSQFVFNEPLDAKLFAFNVPDDFDVQITEDPGPIDDSKLVMETGEGLGPVKFGFSTAEVIEQFGQPHSILNIEEETLVRDVLMYKSRGFQIQVHATHGVDIISASDASLIGETERFTGQFAGGIRIGDNSADVLEALGEPDRKEAGSYIYDSGPAPTSSTSFFFKNDKVSSMSVMQFP